MSVTLEFGPSTCSSPAGRLSHAALHPHGSDGFLKLDVCRSCTGGGKLGRRVEVSHRPHAAN